MFGGNHQIVALFKERHEVQIVTLCTGLNPQTAVGATAGHGGRHPQMGPLVPLVPCNVRPGDSGVRQVMVEQHARTSPALPVDKGHIVADKIGQPANALGVVAPYQQSLRTRHKSEEHHPQPAGREQALNVRDIVVTRLFVQQMGSGQVGLALLQREQPAQAAHMRRDQSQAGMSSMELIAQEVKRDVVAAERIDCAGGRVFVDCHRRWRVAKLGQGRACTAIDAQFGQARVLLGSGRDLYRIEA